MTLYKEGVTTIITILEVVFVVVSVLVCVAFVTLAERKTMGGMQRRLGPNAVGFYGVLQPFADALKLLLKEYVSPTQANKILFFLGPIITLICALLGYLVIPFGTGLVLSDADLGLFYLLAVSAISTYGILLAGWSANSKYAFLGSVRSTAQLISYELVISSAILVIIFFTASLNMTNIIEIQKDIWFIIPLFPLFLILFIASVAETNRPPFDLAEAESELVSGFMTEHAAVIFVFFFLAEYSSIVLICILNTILFLGGYYYYLNLNPLFHFFQHTYYSIVHKDVYVEFLLDPKIDKLVESALGMEHKNKDFTILNTFDNENLIFATQSGYESLVLGVKTSFLIFVFIWVRASFPRVRYDQLMSFSWTILLPLIIVYLLVVPCYLCCFEWLPINLTI